MTPSIKYTTHSCMLSTRWKMLATSRRNMPANCRPGSRKCAMVIADWDPCQKKNCPSNELTATRLSADCHWAAVVTRNEVNLSVGERLTFSRVKVSQYNNHIYPQFYHGVILSHGLQSAPSFERRCKTKTGKKNTKETRNNNFPQFMKPKVIRYRKNRSLTISNKKWSN